MVLVEAQHNLSKPGTDLGRTMVLPALKLDLNGFELRDHSLRQRFSHLQHGMMILLVRELTRNLPPLTEIELHGNRIRPNDAKAARLVTTGSDLSFTLREQFASNTLSTVLAKDPQVANPLLIRYDHAHNLSSETATHANGQSSSSNFRGTGFGAKRSLNVSFATVSIRAVPSRIRWVAVAAQWSFSYFG